MQRQALVSVAALLTFGLGAAHAQDDLSRVTMRVLDDVSGVDAVVLALDASGGEAAEGGAAAAEATDAGRDSDAETTEGERRERELDLERDALHRIVDDERGEGRLEDRDVERPAAPPAPAP